MKAWNRPMQPLWGGVVTVLRFSLRLHTPFRVGSAYARDEVDAALDHNDPLPADHLKGVIRDAAAQLLAPDHPLVKVVFGSPEAPSPWAWTSASPEPAPDWTFTRRHRVTIGAGTHTAVKDHRSRRTAQLRPRFEIHRVHPVWPTSPTSHGYTEDDHVTLLRAAASAVHGLGAWRRRGLGWIGITPDGGPVTEQEVIAVLGWRENLR
jgi:hypothetical protein